MINKSATKYMLKKCLEGEPTQIKICKPVPRAIDSKGIEGIENPVCVMLRSSSMQSGFLTLTDFIECLEELKKE